ncbi:ras-domain-containing protein [Auricularia subglabra TFB-10046 SS5]|nr:ras-domain-containing protein [Auricularia subglabra TFB-10046 SS5]
MASYADSYYNYNGQAGIDAKVVVMGNTGVGKTSIVHRYTENKFTPTSTTSTTGALFVTKKVVVNGFKVRLQLWDTAGQERFRSMAPMYYRNAHAALVVYDITDTKTFDDVRGWLEELKKNCTGDLIIYIVGSKADLARHRAVTHDRARHLLSTWFPPPKPPPLPEPAPQPSNFSYIRPLFSSSPSYVPFPSSPSSDVPGLTRSTSVAASRETRLSTPALSRTPSTPVRRPGPRPIARSAGATSLLSRPKTAGLPTSHEDPVDAKYIEQDAFVARFGQKSSAWPDLRDEDTDAEDEREWGLEKDMRLFEVSAKDARGIGNLFDSLITAIIDRKDVIEKERVERERNSVFLNGISPTWAKLAEEEESNKEREKSVTAKGWGGGCC